MDTLILASRSPRRREIFNRLGLPYLVHSSDIDEKKETARYIRPYVIRISREKAEKTTSFFSSGLVVGVDTLVYFNGKLLGKPHNSEQAHTYLRMLSGNRHLVLSGITLKDLAKGTRYSSCCETEVCFSRITDGEIEQYIESNEWADKAGGYAIQGRAALFVSGIHGCYYNVVGLPVGEMYRLLKRFNYFEKSGYYRPIRKL